MFHLHINLGSVFTWLINKRGDISRKLRNEINITYLKPIIISQGNSSQIPFT